MRYAAYRMPNGQNPNQKRQLLLIAADHLEQYAILITGGSFVIPEPRLLPLLIDTDEARRLLTGFLGANRPRARDLFVDMDLSIVRHLAKNTV